MKFTIEERIALLMVVLLFPKESNFITLKLKRDFENELSFSEKEIKEWEIKTIIEENEARYQWNDQVKEKNIAVGEKLTEMIVEALTKLNEMNKLTNNHFTLYEKFIETKK